LLLFVKPIQNLFFGKSGQQDLVVTEHRMQAILQEIVDINQQKAVRIAQDLLKQQGVLAGIRDRQSRLLSEKRKETVSLAGFPDLALPAADALGAMDFVKLYDSVCAIESAMVDNYKKIRAIRMAGMRQELTMQEAMDSTTVMRPTRNVLAPDTFALPIPKRDEVRLEKFRKDLKQTAKEISSIATYCGKLLEFAKDIDADADWLTMNLYMEDQDLGSGEYRGATLMPDELYDTQDFSMGSFHPVPGRKLTGGGAASQWCFVDSWYVVGPFPNERRRALDTKFGPEAGVDLDASYVGKGGREVKWDYMRVFNLKVEPREVATYAIYYAYSEIYSDRERDVWMSTGTDDHGKLWVNDEHVWTSPTQPKPFKADEHVQMVHLRKGFNQILLRCENAGGTMGFCLLFCTIPVE
jgi:hypothetical protein